MEQNNAMIITMTPDIPGVEYEIIGIVSGNTVRSRNIGRDFFAGLKNIVGGEIKTYTDMLTHAREEAYNRMVNAAIQKGADAIVNLRFVTSEIAPGTAEMVSYGTAVKIKRSGGHTPHQQQVPPHTPQHPEPHTAQLTTL